MLGMKLLEMEKDMKIKHSVSSPPTRYGGTFLAKKFCMGEQTFLSKFMGGCFTWGLMIRSCKGKYKWLRGFKDQFKLVFLSLTLTCNSSQNI